ncbi:MAG: phosphatase PAP2 family protein [Rickettsia conorii subsp. raoultii]|uniref:Phosphatase PAP2 family protein n=1 Tax=Rickettsia conorii subsp. raoultii TaxID=369822 RepID=A0ABY4U0W1_RICCR|nr:phosphatase PAP2 family protein [Rickettsia conorii]URW77521.1 phosphatase PAP2 family protein [Rickettsia conorii subsp. raoultii]
MNVFIKKALSIPRPPSILHMLPINDGSFGFPSGDVQVATAFFMIIFLSFNSKTLKIISITMIINIMLSRLYLGVHSIYDVIGGMIFGVLIVLVYRSNFMQAQISRWENSAKSYYCILAFVIGICFFLWKDSPFLLLLLLPIGTLLGYSIVYICFKYNSDLILNNAQKTIGIILLVSFCYSFFYKTFPIIKNSTILFNFTLLLKFALLPVLIYILLPMMQRELKNRLN